MPILRNGGRMLIMVWALVLLTATAKAADPGIPLPLDGTVSGSKPGSILFFNFYISGATSGNTLNTRISVTNTSTTLPIAVRLFFVSGGAGTVDPLSVASTFLCLVPNQTAAFLASDVDPGIQGYVVAVAIDFVLGCPVSFNFLTGRADVKFSTGHQASLPAQVIAARYSGVLTGCSDSETTATLVFNDGNNGYDRLPRMLAVDKIGSRMDGNDTLIIINRVGGNVSFRTATIGYFKGVMYDESGGSYDFTDSRGRSQYVFSLSDPIPIFATTKFDRLVPAGSRGWMKFWAQNESAIFGAMINLNLNQSGFNGGQNLRALTQVESATLVVPLIPPAC